MRLTFAQKASDRVAAIVGSWRFIIIQSTILALWIIINTFTQYIWDEKPYIMLNLVLSFQAAFTAPIIMMAQNRQSNIDRNKANNGYKLNIKAEQEIRDLHAEVKDLIGIIKAK